MNTHRSTIKFFHELSVIPRNSRQEGRVCEWLKKWAKKHDWDFSEDRIGNLLVSATAKSQQPKTKNCKSLCLQSHMDMVCVADEKHDWETTGVAVIEENGVLRGNGTTLGADNGIGVAAMMAIAEITDRPDLELLFTMGEEIGLVGAHKLEIPITTKYGINLDWSDSTSIGIGCGGTLLIVGRYKPKKIHKKGQLIKIRIAGFKGGHSGVEIHLGIGNAIVELAKILTERGDIIGVSDIKGGDADNAIPRNASATCLYRGEIDTLKSWFNKREKNLQKKLNNPHISITAKIIEEDGGVHYEKNILQTIAKLGSGVQKSLPDNTPISSWNLGKIRLKEGKLKWCYFLRTNTVGGIDPMKKKIEKRYNSTKGVQLELSHETPVWLTDHNSPFVQSILEKINNPSLLPLNSSFLTHGKVHPVTTHATIELGILAEKYPHTQWVSVGATCHDMHTTREHIHLADLEEFCRRLEKVVSSFILNPTQ